jgi:hypothetical protein
MEEEFKLPSPLERARSRRETLKEILANPEDFDDDYSVSNCKGPTPRTPRRCGPSCGRFASGKRS